MKQFLFALCVVAAFFDAANRQPELVHFVGHPAHTLAVK